MLSVVVSYFSLQKMDGNDIYIFKRNVLSDFKVQQIKFKIKDKICTKVKVRWNLM